MDIVGVGPGEVTNAADGSSSSSSATSSTKKRKRERKDKSKSARITLSDAEFSLAHKVFVALVNNRTKTVSTGKSGATVLEYEFVHHDGLRKIYRAVFPQYGKEESQQTKAIDKLIAEGAKRRFPPSDSGQGKKKTFKMNNNTKVYYRLEEGTVRQYRAISSRCE